jgi:hypothetical protein
MDEQPKTADPAELEIEPSDTLVFRTASVT